MAKTLNSDKIKPSPTLNTILMVEDTPKNSPCSVVTVAELKNNSRTGKPQYPDGYSGLSGAERQNCCRAQGNNWRFTAGVKTSGELSPGDLKSEK